MDLRQAVEAAKRILMKEKIDRQLAGQTSSTPFMSIRDNFNKRVTFYDRLHRTEDRQVGANDGKVSNRR